MSSIEYLVLESWRVGGDEDGWMGEWDISLLMMMWFLEFTGDERGLGGYGRGISGFGDGWDGWVMGRGVRIRGWGRR